MSVQVMSAIWRTGLEVRRKIVLLKFADHADDDGRNAWPSKARVAAECGMSLESVKRIIRELRKEGILVPEGDMKGGRGKMVNYRVDFELAAELHPPIDPKDLEAGKKGVRAVTPFSEGAERGSGEPPFVEENGGSPDGKGVTQTPFNEDPERGSPEAEKGVTGDRKGGQSCDPRTILNHPEPSSAPGRARDPDGAAHPVAPEGEGGGNDKPPDDGDGDGEDEALPDPPVNALWRDREAAIRARIGNVDFDAWFGDAIPHSDEDGVYVLAVPGPFQADRINGQYSRILAAMLGRREVLAEFHPYAKVAAHNRKQAGGG